MVSVISVHLPAKIALLRSCLPCIFINWQFQRLCLRQESISSGTDLALSPLAFPIIVTPYGIAAVIVFAALAQDDTAAKLAVASIVLIILFLDWLAMLFVDAILKWTGTALQVFIVVLGVTQIALGLQIITHSLSMIGVFVERTH